jgi:peptidase E
MLATWREFGVINLLKEAWAKGKILCGVSAGAICWFDDDNIALHFKNGKYYKSIRNNVSCNGYEISMVSPHVKSL